MTSVATGTLVEKSRINSIDLMRGIVMVIMALDHTRDFFHINANVFDPTDLTRTSPILFFTRWITHYCAPTFVFLSGVSIAISLERKTRKDLSFFLLTRGLWLVLLEVTFIRFSFVFNLYYDFNVFQVIWAIGMSMILLSALIFIPQRWLLIIGLVIVFGHSTFDFFRLQPEDKGYVVWTILRQAGFVPISEGHGLLALYPLIPWLGIMLTGIGLGQLYRSGFDSLKRKKLLLQLGAAAVALFIVLRLIDVYGDPQHWSVQKNWLFTLMSFLNCAKYPPSLLFTLMTLGPVLLLLSWMEGRELKILNPFLVFGRVPLFYYILHFYVIHAASLVAFMIRYDKSLSEVDFHFFHNTFGGIPFGVGYGLPWVYVAWATLIACLYPICRWYNHYKSTHRYVWLSYL